MCGAGVGPSYSGPSEKTDCDLDASTSDKDDAAAAADDNEDAAETMDLEAIANSEDLDAAADEYDATAEEAEISTARMRDEGTLKIRSSEMETLQVTRVSSGYHTAGKATYATEVAVGDEEDALESGILVTKG